MVKPKIQLSKYWLRIRSSFWFTPATMAIAAVTLALVSVTADKPVTEWLERTFGWSFESGGEGASAVLRVIASSSITIAGVVFSMTLIALTLASSQLGPRLLTSFMRDTRTQVVLGTFVATFIYCLLVLRTIRPSDDAAAVPHLSVTLGVILAVLNVGVLIYFIHHVSVSIQANEIAARIGAILNDKISQLYPGDTRRNDPQTPAHAPDTAFMAAFEQDARPVPSDGDGYLQLVDWDGLVALATEQDLVVRLERKPGNYVVAGTSIVSISPGHRVTDALARQVQTLFVFGHQRTFDQDVEFAVNQLVEMAVRALSPGVNDPFTAIACVDHLGSGLCRLAVREMPCPYRHDRAKRLRVIAPVDTFETIADAAFNQIRQSSRSSAALTLRLLETIGVVAGFARRPEDRATLLRHAEMIARGAGEGLPEAADRRAAEARWQTTSRLCGAAPASIR